MRFNQQIFCQIIFIVVYFYVNPIISFLSLGTLHFYFFEVNYVLRGRSRGEITLTADKNENVF